MESTGVALPQEVFVSCVRSGITPSAAGTPVGSKASQPVLPRFHDAELPQDGVLIAVTEKRTRVELDALVSGLKQRWA